MSDEPTATAKPALDKWPVIVNTSLKDGEIMKLLSQHHRVRVSENTVEQTCIFPLSGIAFMIQAVHDGVTSWPPQRSVKLKSDIVGRLEKFLRIHRRCYLLLLADLHGPQELSVLAGIQQRFFNQHLMILPVHSYAECVNSMLKIAKVTCQPSSAKLKSWILTFLKQQVIGQGAVLDALALVGLSSHQSNVLVDGLGSFSAISTADKDTLMDCSLDETTAEKVVRYFEKDCYAVTI